MPLHSNMFRLIRPGSEAHRLRIVSLHSNMFRLIRGPRPDANLKNAFTFQYVQINTFRRCVRCPFCSSLHSNMFRLIPAFRSSIFAIFPSFTFQYVQINTRESAAPIVTVLSLHSNMFRLIPRISVSGTNSTQLYIPICLD